MSSKQSQRMVLFVFIHMRYQDVSVFFAGLATLCEADRRFALRFPSTLGTVYTVISRSWLPTTWSLVQISSTITPTRKKNGYRTTNLMTE